MLRYRDNPEKNGIDDMRLIQLMHPEFQINKELVGKRVLENAEICNEVSDEQHGSRKHHQAVLLALNKCNIGEIFRLFIMLACYGINNVIGCFDRIYHTSVIIIWHVWIGIKCCLYFVPGHEEASPLYQNWLWYL